MSPLPLRLLASFLTFAGLLLPAARLLAEEEPPKIAPGERLDVINLTVSPATAPIPLLKQRLAFERLDLRPGNAALMYTKVMLLTVPNSQPESLEIRKKIDEWVELPADKLPREEVRAALRRYDSSLELIDIAVHRERCDWELPLKETDNPFGIVLPELQELRYLSRILLLKGRLEMLDGKYDQALATLRTGMTMGRHAAGPTLVNGLVGIAITNVMLKEFAAWIDRPDAPSLYWALTTVPHPWIDLNPSIELDVNSMYLLYPDLYQARDKSKRLSDEQWKGLYASVLTKTNRIQREFEAMALEGQPFTSAARLAKSLAALSASRKTMARYGYSAKEVEQMPVEKLSLLHDVMVFEEARDSLIWNFAVPYAQMAKTGEQGKGWEKLPDTIVLPDPKMLLPAIQQARRAEARLERHFAALRLVEAVRLHAGANGGKLPAKLSDITVVPISDNPFNGQPFDYRLDGDTAVIFAAGQQPQEYRIKLRTK
jgi:hypothetical protein